MLIEDFVFSLSVVNLWFYREWSHLLISGWRLYFIWPTNEAMAGLLLTVAALGLSLFLILTFTRLWFPGFFYRLLVNATILVTIILFLNGLRLTLTSFRNAVAFVTSQFFVFEIVKVAMGPVFLIGWVIVRWNRHFIAIGRFAALILFPLLLLNSYRIVKKILHPHPMVSRVVASRVPSVVAGVDKNRVLIFLFDEFDFGVGFEKRASTLELPHIDAFKSNAFFSTNAYPPNSCTTLSIPSFFLGKIVTGLKGVDEKDNYFYLPGSNEPIAWTSLPNIFEKVKRMGFTTAAVAPYHPICMLFGTSLDHCINTPSHSLLHFGYTHSIWSSMVDHARALGIFRVHDGAPFHLDSFERLYDAAKTIAVDPSIHFAYLHLNIPHTPRIYDATRQRLTSTRGMDFMADYLDNLFLADRTWGELSARMKTSGAWHNSTVIFTTDHWWYHAFRYRQKENWRVPFIVKLPNENTPFVYTRAFNTVVVHDLVLALFKGIIQSNRDLARWLDQNASYQRPVKCDDDALLPKRRNLANALSGR